jgi:hypothetical protein
MTDPPTKQAESRLIRPRMAGFLAVEIARREVRARHWKAA